MLQAMCSKLHNHFLYIQIQIDTMIMAVLNSNIKTLRSNQQAETQLIREQFILKSRTPLSLEPELE